MSSKWQGTAVPNTGYVEKVYFNTNLSVEEVNSLLGQISYNEEYGNMEAILVSSNNEIAIMKVSDNEYIIAEMLNGIYIFNTSVAYEGETGFIGWDSNFNGILEINAEVSSQANAPVGTQNNLLSSLFSTTPFVQAKEKMVVFPKSWVEDLTNAIREKEESTEKISGPDIPNRVRLIETGVDTTDATATDKDILLGKTAYVNEVKVEGVIETYDGSFENEAEKIPDFKLGAVSNVAVDSFGVISWDALDVTEYADYKPTVKYLVNVNGTENTVSTNGFNAISYLNEGTNNITITGKITFNFTRDNLEKVEIVQFTLPTDVVYVKASDQKTPIYIDYACGTTYNNEIYCFGGDTTSAKKTTIIDPVNKTSRTLTNIPPINHYNGGACEYNGKIYIFGGGVDNQYGKGNGIYCFDIASETFTTMTATLPTAWQYCIARAYNDKIYIFRHTSETGNNVVCYYPTTDTINALSVSGGTGNGVCLYNDKFYLFGGFNSGKDIYCFDPTTNTATKILTSKNGLTGYVYTLTVAVNDNIYLILGNYIYRFNVTSNTLTLLDATFSNNNNHHSIYGYIDGKLYIATPYKNPILVVHNLS